MVLWCISGITPRYAEYTSPGDSDLRIPHPVVYLTLCLDRTNKNGALRRR